MNNSTIPHGNTGATMPRQPSPQLTARITYERAQRFIRMVGGTEVAEQITVSEAAFLACNWARYPIKVRYELAKVAGVNLLQVSPLWCGMTNKTRDDLGTGVGRACAIALEILAHPPAGCA